MEARDGDLEFARSQTLLPRVIFSKLGQFDSTDSMIVEIQ